MAVKLTDREGRVHKFDDGASTKVGANGELVVLDAQGKVTGRVNPTAWGVVWHTDKP